MESIIILLTGTIQVFDVPDLAMTDTDLREREYFAAIKKWTRLNYPVIFCENSNYDSGLINEHVKNIDAQKFEYLKFGTKASYLGKGHGEAEIINYVFDNSKLINDHTIICKATGKNFVTNAGSICKEIAESPIFQNLVIAILTQNLTIADSRFFFFRPAFYFNYWKHYLEEIDEANHQYMEHILAKAILAAVIAGEKWTLLPELPIVEGYFGTKGTKYKSGFFRGLFYNMLYWIAKKMALGRK
ncbi:hypothetical protein BH11BAC3_BH11BAC3_02660 [soil metagenome]